MDGDGPGRTYVHARVYVQIHILIHTSMDITGRPPGSIPVQWMDISIHLKPHPAVYKFPNLDSGWLVYVNTSFVT